MIDLFLAFNYLIQLILTFLDLPTERIDIALVVRELLLELVQKLALSITDTLK
ncbi:hypothetical protein D3C71_2203840 [compost metagenome]